jgi:hypothetical protein
MGHLHARAAVIPWIGDSKAPRHGLDGWPEIEPRFITPRLITVFTVLWK